MAGRAHLLTISSSPTIQPMVVNLGLLATGRDSKSLINDSPGNWNAHPPVCWQFFDRPLPHCHWLTQSVADCSWLVGGCWLQMIRSGADCCWSPQAACHTAFQRASPCHVQTISRLQTRKYVGTLFHMQGNPLDRHSCTGKVNSYWPTNALREGVKTHSHGKCP